MKKLITILLVIILTQNVYADPEPKPCPTPDTKNWRDELIRRAGDVVVGVAITVIGNAISKPSTPTPSPTPRPQPINSNHGADPSPDPCPAPRFDH